MATTTFRIMLNFKVGELKESIKSLEQKRVESDEALGDLKANKVKEGRTAFRITMTTWMYWTLMVKLQPERQA